MVCSELYRNLSYHNHAISDRIPIILVNIRTESHSYPQPPTQEKSYLSQPSIMSVCDKDGTKLDDKWNFCPMCAHPLKDVAAGGGDANKEWKILQCPQCKGEGRKNFIKGNYGRGGKCEACSGVGHLAVAKDAKQCKECRGAGSIQMMGRSSPCDKCRGHGFEKLINPKLEAADLIELRCMMCKGSGRHHNAQCGTCEGKGNVKIYKEKIPCGFCANKGMLTNNMPCHVCGGGGFSFAASN